MKNKVIYLQGGLGNQLFQYAFGLFIEQKAKTPVVYSTSFLNVYFPQKTPRKFELSFLKNKANFIHAGKVESYLRFYFIYLARKLNLLDFFKIMWEQDKNNPNKMNLDHLHYVGYWQNIHFILPIKDILAQKIKSQFEFSSEAKKYLQQIKQNLNSISIHVRRGDFITNKLSSQIYYPCSVEYYKKSFEQISSTLQNPTVYIFSDDINWCRQNFTFIPNIVYVELKATHAFNEVLLMSECRYNIIANSTFSWWSAMLNTNPEKQIICPKKWFFQSDENTVMIPSDWKVLDNN